jgi:hypothetical protein
VEQVSDELRHHTHCAEQPDERLVFADIDQVDVHQGAPARIGTGVGYDRYLIRDVEDRQELLGEHECGARTVRNVRFHGSSMRSASASSTVHLPRIGRG